MNINNLMKAEHEEIVFKQRGVCRMVLAYHTFGIGTTFGGIRILPNDAGGKALKDALRLSEAMSYKLALINEPFGGSKAVVLEPEGGKTEEFLHDIGELVEQEEGRFITAIDFGFEPDDAKVIRQKTGYILAIKDTPFGQSGVTTAYGVFKGIITSLEHATGTGDIGGRSFAVQGLGSLGRVLANELINAGGNVYVSDLSNERLKEFEGRAQIVSPDELLFLDVDVLAPCGPAYVINQNTILNLNCRIIAGGANCQLEDEVEDDKRLLERGILIAPDYALNAGGVMQGIEEFRGGRLENTISSLPVISKNLKEIFMQSRKNGIGTYAVAKQMALERIDAMEFEISPE